MGVGTVQLSIFACRDYVNMCVNVIFQCMAYCSLATSTGTVRKLGGGGGGGQALTIGHAVYKCDT